MVVFILFNFNSRFSQSPQGSSKMTHFWGQLRSNILNGPVGVFAAAIHLWFSLCWVFWFYFAFICVFKTKESVIIWIVDINEFFESKDCSFITLTDCILACSLWIFANNFVISGYFELKQGQYHVTHMYIVRRNFNIFNILSHSFIFRPYKSLRSDHTQN